METFGCSRCGKEKEISEKSRRGNWCKECSKAYDRELYLKTKDKQLALGYKRIEEARKWLKEKKEQCSCEHCGEDDPIVLEFHHRDPATKEFNISDGIRYSIKRIEAEIEKCIVLCANCHRRLHHKLKTTG